MANYAQHYAKRGPTPQSAPMPGREAEQVVNDAGGYVFALDDWASLDRFLVMGASEGTYYVGERELTIENAKTIERLILLDGPRVVARIVEISEAGRAPKNDPALFALALCASAADIKTRQEAMAVLPKVARIGTHLFMFAEFVNKMRGWGRGLRRGVSRWYLDRAVGDLAMQVVKYQQRVGWSHRDLLRLAHPSAEAGAADRQAVFDWVCRKAPSESLPDLIQAFDMLKADPTPGCAIAMIERFNLPREAIPTELLNDPDVWKALLQRMPMTAMVRNLGKMTSIGVLAPLSSEIGRVVKALSNDDGQLQKSRIHPIALLLALKTYAAGHGDKGKLSWVPVPQVIDALDKAFYLAFSNVRPTGKRFLLGVDVSPSMGGSVVAGTSLKAREVASAMALVIAATEPNHMIMGFAGGFVPLPITPRMRLDSVIQLVSGLGYDRTDCALPWRYADKHQIGVDCVITTTDNETWSGDVHPGQAVKSYRAKTGIAARNIVIGTDARPFTINDPKDPLGLDIAGFDAAVPELINQFVLG